MNIRESAEMYLETILVLSKSGPVRSIDVAKTMNFARPTVSVAIHNLEKDGYLKITEEQNLELQPKGLEIAEKIYERHTVLSALLESIGVSKETAAEDACKMEHDISVETFECIKKSMENHKQFQK